MPHGVYKVTDTYMPAANMSSIYWRTSQIESSLGKNELQFILDERVGSAEDASDRCSNLSSRRKVQVNCKKAVVRQRYAE